jgi:hypothetical protein
MAGIPRPEEVEMNRHTSTRYIMLSLALFSVFGCRVIPLAPQAQTPPSSRESAASLSATNDAHGFYPLELGNRWNYARTYDSSFELQGTVYPYHRDSAIERELACEQTFDSRLYTLERSLETTPMDVQKSWIAYRQDRAGLYEADGPGPPPCDIDVPASLASMRGPRSNAMRPEPSRPTNPAARTAMAEMENRLAVIRYTLGIPAPSMRRPRPANNEITRLAYPLFVGRRWTIRTSPSFTSHVEGLELLRVPAGRFLAWRVRIDSELFSPNDRVVVWYGRKGFLKLVAHVETVSTDENGNVNGHGVSDDREVLTDLALANHFHD